MYGFSITSLGHTSFMLHGFNGIYAHSQTCIMLAVALAAEALRISVDSTPILLYVGIRTYVDLYCRHSNQDARGLYYVVEVWVSTYFSTLKNSNGIFT